MSVHTGSHVEGPNHAVESALSIDRLPLERFLGEGVKLDLRQKGEMTELGVSDLEGALKRWRPAGQDRRPQHRLDGSRAGPPGGAGVLVQGVAGTSYKSPNPGKIGECIENPGVAGSRLGWVRLFAKPALFGMSEENVG